MSDTGISDAFSIGLSANYIGKYYGDFTNTEERITGDYAVARFNINFEQDNWFIAGFINNAFDEDAQVSREPVGGRYPQGYAAIVDPRNLGFSITCHF
ncbi:hypothetical protein ACCI51_04450 [Microbulbifer echini]|uniref:TonB-dependent receptor n=1 Tax=Microbulbifer echini TaxID=1529067 RepID=A0ABV4NKC3_9GAMM|nr:hypothetical protein [uncultured Microbulbifer sp.]